MFARIAPVICALALCMTYGIVAQKNQWFPAKYVNFVVNQASLAIETLTGEDTWYYLDTAEPRQVVEHYDESLAQSGLTLITGVTADKTLSLRVVDMDGAIVHQWQPDWYQIWPDAPHVHRHHKPRGIPGTHIHGSKLLDNGDIIFNFENLSLVRLDACGEVVFKLPHLTHHSIFEDEQGDFWVPSQKYQTQPRSDLPNLTVPYKEDTVLKVSPSGEVLAEYSIVDILVKNGYDGLLYMSAKAGRHTKVKGDLHHLNDVEVFPSTMSEGVFKHGDVMVSLRNINTVFVFDPQSLAIRFISIGQYVRQHDPDFIDGNTISVYDNNNMAALEHEPQSRIVLQSALDSSLQSYLKPQDKLGFYTNIMGKHQWLANGNLLILESMNGRVFEVTPDKQLVWQYNNVIANESLVGIMEGAERLAPKYDRAFFSQLASRCDNN